jgi:hypothetical protein
MYQRTPAQNEKESPALPYMPVQVSARVAGKTEEREIKMIITYEFESVEIVRGADGRAVEGGLPSFCFETEEADPKHIKIDARLLRKLLEMAESGVRVQM